MYSHGDGEGLRQVGCGVHFKILLGMGYNSMARGVERIDPKQYNIALRVVTFCRKYSRRFPKLIQ